MLFVDGNIQWAGNEEMSHAKYSSVDGNLSKCLKHVHKKGNCLTEFHSNSR